MRKMTICDFCKSEVDNEELFCPFCGNKLSHRLSFSDVIDADFDDDNSDSVEKTKEELITNKLILQIMKKHEWLNIKNLIKLLDIKDVKDARYLQLKLKQLTREKKVLLTIQSGRTYWKLNKAEVNL